MMYFIKDCECYIPAANIGAFVYTFYYLYYMRISIIHHILCRYIAYCTEAVNMRISIIHHILYGSILHIAH